MDTKPLTVSALTRRIHGELAALGPIEVQGELSQVKVSANGHLYATLKDAEAVLPIVVWRTSLARMSERPRDGTLVVARGSLDVYAPRGAYQLVCTRLVPAGQGDLHARFLALKARLEQEGLFDPERKRPLPLLPRAVGVATAAGSAALADILHSLRTRFPAMHIVHAPCLVQGPGAAASVAAALRRLEQHPAVDVIICGRGGGSLEDLWAFNEEPVVRAIAACAVPVVSAVGHETDTTLADFAADVRAKTPTAAGELVVPVAAELHEDLRNRRTALDDAIAALADGLRARLAAAASHRALAGPAYQVRLRMQRLDELRGALDAAAAASAASASARLASAQARLSRRSPAARLVRARERVAGAARAVALALDRRHERGAARLAAAAARLDALSPLAVIARGYSVLRDGQGRLVRTLADAPPGTRLRARVPDGWLHATVDGAQAQRLNEPDAPYRI